MNSHLTFRLLTLSPVIIMSVVSTVAKRIMPLFDRVLIQVTVNPPL